MSYVTIRVLIECPLFAEFFFGSVNIPLRTASQGKNKTANQPDNYLKA
jgi:hypothetical protein